MRPPLQEGGAGVYDSDEGVCKKLLKNKAALLGATAVACSVAFPLGLLLPAAVMLGGALGPKSPPIPPPPPAAPWRPPRQRDYNRTMLLWLPLAVLWAVGFGVGAAYNTVPEGRRQLLMMAALGPALWLVTMAIGNLLYLADSLPDRLMRWWDEKSKGAAKPEPTTKQKVAEAIARYEGKVEAAESIPHEALRKVFLHEAYLALCREAGRVLHAEERG